MRRSTPPLLRFILLLQIVDTFVPLFLSPPGSSRRTAITTAALGIVSGTSGTGAAVNNKRTDALELGQLDEFELKLLHDFVRGRGFGSVSKLPHDELFNHAGDEDVDHLDPNDKDVVSIGGHFSDHVPTLITPTPLPATTTAARRKATGESNRARTLADLTLLLKSFIQRRREEEGISQIDDGIEPFASVVSPRPSISTLESRRLSVLSQHQRPSLFQNVDPQRLASVFSRIKGGISKLKTTPSTVGTTASTRTYPVKDAQQTHPPAQSPKSYLPQADVPAVNLPPPNQWLPMDREEASVEENEPPIAFSATIAPPPPPPSLNAAVLSAEIDRLDKISQLRQQLNELLGATVVSPETTTTTTTTIRTTTPTTTTTTRSPSSRVFVLREGSAEQIAQSQYRFIATSTLIFDDRKRILVDTGLATDINGRTEILQKMADLNVAPPTIDIVVTTHGHPDHAGNTNEFPDAKHYAGFFMHHHTTFNLSDLFEKDTQRLTENVHLVRAPGHTSDDIAVIVKNSLDYGTVAITEWTFWAKNATIKRITVVDPDSGDVFIRKEDMDYQMMWRPLSFNEDMQNMSRRKLLCQVDYIIPGHGGGFHVSMEMRRKFACHRTR